MKKNFLVLTVFTFGAAVAAHAQAAQAPAPAPPKPMAGGAASAPSGPPTKVAIVQLQMAVVRTQEGQKAAADMQIKYGPRRTALEKQQSDLAGLQEQLQKGGATLSDAAKQKMATDISTGQKRLQRDGEDFDAEVQNYENGLMQDMVTKMVDVIAKYSTQNGYAMVVDVSNQQSPLIWADQANVITEAVIKLYDQAHPATVPAGAAPAKPPAAPPVKK